jgi:hypothetical protein
MLSLIYDAEGFRRRHDTPPADTPLTPISRRQPLPGFFAGYASSFSVSLRRCRFSPRRPS